MEWVWLYSVGLVLTFTSLLQDIFKHCTEEGIMSVTEIPYFDGDFWPNVIEETIKELDHEAKQREASETTDVSEKANHSPCLAFQC